MENLSSKYLELVKGKDLYPPLNGYSIFIQGSEYNIKKYFGKWYKDKNLNVPMLLLVKEEVSQVWHSETDLKLTTSHALNEFINNQEEFNKKLSLFYKNIDIINDLYEKYTYKKISDSSWNQLLSIVEEIRDLIWDANAAVYFSVYLDKKFCWEILEKIKYEITKEDLDSIWKKATEPAFESFDKSQLEDFLNCLNEEKKWAEIVEHCQYFLTDYYSAKTLKEIEKDLKEKFSEFIGNRDLAIKTLKKERNELENITKNHEIWLDTLPENTRKVAEFAQLVMKTRDRRKNFFAKALTIIYRIAEKMFSEKNVDRDLIPFYTMRELLKGPEFLEKSIKNIENRRNGFQLLIPFSGEIEMLEAPIEEAMEEVNNYFISTNSSENETEIKGQICSRGKIQGKVKVILNVNSDHNFQEGEVLVAGMTRPEYVPLMKKAAAIVTDEGGITCHAAIVSREMKKACVIGTKIATKTLRDGDLVEVDADNGIIKILK